MQVSWTNIKGPNCTSSLAPLVVKFLDCSHWLKLNFGQILAAQSRGYNSFVIKITQYTIDPITPTSFTISAWYNQDTDAYWDNIFFLSNNGQSSQSIALNQGYWGIAGMPTLMFNSAVYRTYVSTPKNVWVYMTAVYNMTASNNYFFSYLQCYLTSLRRAF